MLFLEVVAEVVAVHLCHSTSFCSGASTCFRAEIQCGTANPISLQLEHITYCINYRPMWFSHFQWGIIPGFRLCTVGLRGELSTISKRPRANAGGLWNVPQVGGSCSHRSVSSPACLHRGQSPREQALCWIFCWASSSGTFYLFLAQPAWCNISPRQEWGLVSHHAGGRCPLFACGTERFGLFGHPMSCKWKLLHF